MPEAKSWPIAANLGQIGNRAKDGGHAKDAPASEWATTLKAVRKLGVEEIDPTDMWVPLAELSEARLAEFSRVLDDTGVSIPSISLTRHSIINPGQGEFNLAKAHRTLDLAPELGVSVVNLGFMEALAARQQSALWFWLEDGHHDDEALRPLALERVRELADHAQQNGVQLSMEMYEDTFLGTADDAVAFLRDLDHDAVGLNPDIGNFVRLHREIEDVTTMFEKVLPLSNFWHIKNYSRDFDPRTGAYSTVPLPLKYGFINYRAVIGRALELGFDGPFCCEHYGADSLGVVAENVTYVREVLDYWA
ncbi:sugar phosphate isomerase/epimerase family protein [Psychromicrobium xiongbiense]|uniref:sugar phosphate isomerase/epimerase family protein n=1 Tax=Psychromicrobium xiongbiense TaxID=3051184 RepID=UPI00255456D1|nr:sugar phosphate isomerase/epimerase family protein [Psychromicrobium sp. YIM S02556]